MTGMTGMTTKKTWVRPSVAPLATARDAENARGIVGDGALLRGLTS